MAVSGTTATAEEPLPPAQPRDPAEQFSYDGSSTGLWGLSGVTGSSGNSPIPGPSDSDPFYDPAGITLGDPGTVHKTKPASYTPMLPGLDWALPKRVTKIMYSSTNQRGERTPVTGYVMEPSVPWRGDGPRPTVVVGRGTVGQADKCAPSRNWPLDGQPDPLISHRAVNFEGLYEWAFANAGVRVVVTDYVGMGTPGLHTYMNRLDQAHAMADAARAARTMVTGQGEKFGKVGFYGHSQGGGASAAAVEEAASYAPDLEVAGAYASAPPADLSAVQRNIDGSDLVGAIGFTINSVLNYYPQLKPVLAERLSDQGMSTLDHISNMCTNEITDVYGHQHTSEWSKDGRSLDAHLAEIPEAQVALEDQRIGNGRPQAPVMIISGRYDQNVEYHQAKDLAARWCEKGATVVYRNDVLPPIGEYNHFAQAVSGHPFGVSFLLDRFNGLPVQGACGQPGGLPGS
ncbi:lipase [Corynebacterium heidelbergense]|uniref:Lipase n=2 Tax=Corynebacterium heidelbergense TaxID=2055947 RepID=A0A364V3Q3_9CORY|nr:lipase [Corynebacterium heidelbergense]